MPFGSFRAPNPAPQTAVSFFIALQCCRALLHKSGGFVQICEDLASVSLLGTHTPAARPDLAISGPVPGLQPLPYLVLLVPGTEGPAPALFSRRPWVTPQPVYSCLPKPSENSLWRLLFSSDSNLHPDSCPQASRCGIL